MRLSLHDPAGVPILRPNLFGSDTGPMIAFVREPWRESCFTPPAASCALQQLATMFQLKNRWLCGTISRFVSSGQC
jgi:hypothetical protein